MQELDLKSDRLSLGSKEERMDKGTKLHEIDDADMLTASKLLE